MSKKTDYFELSKAQKGIVEAMMTQQLFVRAGAGTGKTATMVEGIVDCLRRCPKNERKEFFDHVFMITFTNNAADELKTRLRKRLLEDENPSIRKLAVKVEDAWVSTIHGLCSRILKMYALEAGLNPQFGHCSEIERELLLKQAKDEISSKLREDSEFHDLFAFFGFEKTGGYKNLSAPDIAYEIAEKLSEAEKEEDVQWVPLDVERMNEVVKKYPEEIYQLWAEYIPFCESVDYSQKKSKDEWERWLVNYKESFDKLSSLVKDWASLEDKYYSLALMPWPNGNCFFAKPGRDYINAIKEKTSTFFACANTLLFQKKMQEPLMVMAKMIKERFDKLKQDRGILDDDDLLEKCLSFLNDEKAEICHTFTLAIVDEFQDTNRKQLKIIEKLAKDRNALCFVGDAQQSIYRFRGADLDLYEEIYNKLQKEDEGREEEKKYVRTLTENYRSHPEILDFVTKTLGEEKVLENYLELTPPKEKKKKEIKQTEKSIEESEIWEGNRILVEYSMAKDIGQSNRHKDFNTTQVSERIASLLNEAKNKAKKMGEKAKLKENDIAILSSNKIEVEKVSRSLNFFAVNALRVNQDVSGISEFNVIENLLVTLANSGDTEDGVLPLLAGPMFEISPSDLVLLAKGNETYHLSDLTIHPAKDLQIAFRDELEDRTYQAFDVLYKIRGLRKTHSVSELVEYACKQSGWFSRLALDYHAGYEKVANINNAIRVIKEIVDDAGYGLSSAPALFAAWRANTKGRAALLNTSKKGAVFVETVYQSKGLQYPVVVVSWPVLEDDSPKKRPFFETSFKEKTFMVLKPTISKKQAHHAVAEKIKSAIQTKIDPVFYENLTKIDILSKEPETSEEVVETKKKLLIGESLLPDVAYVDVLAVEKNLDLAEKWRLLYVAITRAEYGVILCIPQRIGKNGPGKQGVLMSRFDKVLGLSKGEKEKEHEGSITIEKDSEQKTIPYKVRPVILEGSKEKPQLTEEELGDLKESLKFLVFENNETPLPKIPWGFMQDVGSYSSDAHQVDEEAGEVEDGLMDFKNRKKAAHAIIESLEGKPEFEFGSAFHELAQIAALQKEEPSAKQITARAKFHRLDVEKTEALEQAIHTWWNSALRKEAYAMSHLEPEYPFFMKDYNGSDKPYRRGFIDLLAFEGTRAVVVDYKTGEQNLSESEARETHLAQCEWYARALLLAGFTEVTVKFILVQNLDANGSPLVVDFGTYTEDSIPEIEVAEA